MKVLQVCAYAAPYEGNFMKSLYALDKALKEYGHDTIYVFPETASQIPWCQQLARKRTVYFLPLEKARIRLSTYTGLRKIFSKYPDIIVAHSHFELYDLPLSIVTPKRVRLFWHLHDPLVPSKKKSREILKLLQYKYFSRHSILLSVADKYKENLIAIGFPSKRAYTLLNGIDLERIRVSYDNEDKSYDFLAFVWNTYNKGCDVLLNACKRLVQDNYTFSILLIGNDDAKREIEKYFPDGVSEIVLQGAVNDVNKLYEAAKVFVSSSRAETFSYAVCESAYAGLPVTSSRIIGLEWASELPTVEFFENEDVIALYEKMKAYLDGRTVSTAAISQTREVIAKRYSVEHWAKEVCRFYDL